MLVLEWKERGFIEKVNSRCFCWFPAAILVHQNGAPIWRLHTKLYKGAWNVSANNSETVGHKDLRLGQIVYILVFYNISFSWLLPLDSFQFIFLCCVYCMTVKTIYITFFLQWKSIDYHVINLPWLTGTAFLREWMIISSWNLANTPRAY